LVSQKLSHTSLIYQLFILATSSVNKFPIIHTCVFIFLLEDQHINLYNLKTNLRKGTNFQIFVKLREQLKPPRGEMKRVEDDRHLTESERRYGQELCID